MISAENEYASNGWNMLKGNERVTLPPLAPIYMQNSI